MFPTVLAWIGIGFVAIWTISYIVGTVLVMDKYRDVVINKKDPSNPTVASSCVMVTAGLISLPVYILLLIFGYSPALLITTIAIVAFFSLDAYLADRRKKKKLAVAAEDNEKTAEGFEKMSTAKRIFGSSVYVLFTTIFRLAPFVLFLVLAK